MSGKKEGKDKQRKMGGLVISSNSFTAVPILLLAVDAAAVMGKLMGKGRDPSKMMAYLSRHFLKLLQFISP